MPARNSKLAKEEDEMKEHKTREAEKKGRENEPPHTLSAVSLCVYKSILNMR